jgi:hypothetical protein
MSYPLLMQVLQSLGEALDDGASLHLCEADSLLYMIQKWTTFYLLKDQVEKVRLLKVLYQLDDVLMSLAKVVDFNLFEDLRSAVEARPLLNDLDSVLNASEHIFACLHSAIAPFTQAFACQLVQVLKKKRFLKESRLQSSLKCQILILRC